MDDDDDDGSELFIIIIIIIIIVNHHRRSSSSSIIIIVNHHHHHRRHCKLRVVVTLPKVEADMNFCNVIRNLLTWSSSSLFTVSASFRASVSLLFMIPMLPPLHLRLFLRVKVIVFVDPSMISAMLLLLILFTDDEGESRSSASSLMIITH